MKSSAVAGALCGIGLVIALFNFRGLDPASSAMCMLGVAFYGVGCLVGLIGALI